MKDCGSMSLCWAPLLLLPPLPLARVEAMEGPTRPCLTRFQASRLLTNTRQTFDYILFNS